MSIDSVGLLAQQSYSQIQSRPKLNVVETPMNKAVNFHDMVDKQFNSFSRMSPAQILSHIQGAKTANINMSRPAAHTMAVSNGNASGFASSVVKNARSAVSNQEQTARKSLIGEASLVDLLTATTEAKNVMDTTVRVRDKFLEAFDKVMNMSM